jgi:hypothetical protein
MAKKFTKTELITEILCNFDAKMPLDKKVQALVFQSRILDDKKIDSCFLPRKL